jgi:hypothetical protein
MKKHGPVDVVVLAFGEARFDRSALTELKKQSAAGTIRVLDLIILQKDGSGQCYRIEASDLPSEQAAALDLIEAEFGGLFDDEDASMLCEGMVPGSALVGLAIENTWAVELANAIHSEGGELAFNFRIPAPIVDEAFEKISTG